ncbi:malonic semialdehyde reductase [Georgenia alba]|uniref:Malonic semialdehyde reductase n=1 Tax=Georgenia alba TaxID=2233858 RepID=A0ABW2QAM7_9MICO
MTETEQLTTPLDEQARHVLFAGAHTTNTFTPDPVDVEVVRRAYEDLRWAPTSMNIQPLRITVLSDPDVRARVVDQLIESNRTKTLAAPLSLVAAYDPAWHEHAPLLAPHREGMRESFAGKPELRDAMGRTNGLIQLGYLLLALRAHGLQVGPMTGLDPAGVDSVVHAQNGWRTLAVVNVGHAPDPHDEKAQRPRAGRLEFAQATQLL